VRSEFGGEETKMKEIARGEGERIAGRAQLRGART